MTDRELLELAAKAAGVKIYWHVGKPYFRKEMELLDFWNPLTDDGDALRLAVKLNLRIEFARVRGESKPSLVQTSPHGMGYIGELVQLGADPYAATRRAIVRAAAAIGKESECRT